MSDGAYKICRACGKQRKTTRRGLMTRHNKWNGVLGRMVLCLGSGKPPR